MKVAKLLMCMLVVLGALGPAVQAHAAYEFYMTIQGTKTGMFKGESTREAWKNFLPCLGLQFGVEAPRDAATGMATGKRQYQPLTITKEWGAASPQIFQALVTNEVLKQVVLQFPTVTPAGVETVATTLTLTNATISKVEYRVDMASNPLQPGQGRLLEDVSFTFQSIEVKSAAGTVATDSPSGNFTAPRLLLPGIAPHG